LKDSFLLLIPSKHFFIIVMFTVYLLQGSLSDSLTRMSIERNMMKKVSVTNEDDDISDIND